MAKKQGDKSKAGFRELKPVRIRKDGKPDRRFVEDPLTKICRQRLEELRNERLQFVVVGDPAKCDQGCWQQKQCQMADRRAFQAYGDQLQEAQFPLVSLQSIDEVTENFRGYILRCPCTFASHCESDSNPTEGDTNQ